MRAHRGLSAVGAREICLVALILSASVQVWPQSYQRRNRGESFHNVLTSNTAGAGDVWVTLTAVGHVWDNDPINMDTTGTHTAPKRLWVSNVRGFPEGTVQAGLFDFAMLTLGSRVLSYGFRPGWIAGDLKLTWPNNKELRLNGFALDCKYRHTTRDTSPTLGGYIGFMPEGFVVHGGSLDARLIYELDLIAKFSFLPLRLLVNGGIRIPFEREPDKLYQYLADAGIVYSGYGFDFFATYSLEAFNNFTEPILIQQRLGREFLVFFSENLSYFTLGGTVRYDNGLQLSLSVPMLLSLNQESRMTGEDQDALGRKEGLYPTEERLGIKNPFDPWFVKWKIVGSLAFPIRGKITGAEMMRDFLIKKNRKLERRIDIDDRLQGGEVVPEQDDAKRRLEEIRKKREEMKKAE